MTLDQVVKHFGSQAAAARALGIKQPAVAQWRKGVPKLRQLQIQVVTAGKLQARQQV